MLEFIIPSKEETTVTFHIGEQEVSADLGDLQLMLEKSWELQIEQKAESAIPYFCTLFNNEFNVELNTTAAILIMQGVFDKMAQIKKKSLILSRSVDEAESPSPTQD